MAAIPALLLPAAWLFRPGNVSGQRTRPRAAPPARKSWAITPAQIPPVHFVDMARAAGVSMLDVYGGDKHKDYILETTGNGAVIFDYNNDGWPDIYLPNGSIVGGFPAGQAPTGRLYRNNHDGTFTDVTHQAGLDRHPGWAQGACVGDYDNDGHLDLLVTYWGQNVLYHNNGDGTFTDVTKQAGLLTPRREWNSGCAFTDYNHDGKADIFVSRYVQFAFNKVPKPGQGPWCQWKGIPVMCGPRGLPGTTNALYRNNGDGTFTDVTIPSGIGSVSGYYGLTPLTGDFTHDGWDDIYVADDTTPNILYHNAHGHFADVATLAGVAYNEDGAEQAGMGVSAGDYLRNGNLDIVKTNFSDDTPTLYKNWGDGTFDDVTYAAGLGDVTRWLGWGVAFLDYDNSGWPGIFIANGHVYPEVDGKGLGTSYREPKVLYYNLRNGKFANITANAGAALSLPRSARGVAVGDLFNDGRLEVVVNNMNETPSIYRNTGPIGHFISLKLEGVRSNRAALGAEATLFQDGLKTLEEVRSGGGFISQSDLRLHFGLGADRAAQKIVIRWPSGVVDTLRDLPADRFYTVAEGRGVVAALTRGVGLISPRPVASLAGKTARPFQP